MALSERDAFESRYTQLLERIPADVHAAHIADARVVWLPGDVPPWTDTGLTVAQGDRITLLAAGRVTLLPGTEMWSGPRMLLWGRVGETGEIFKGTQDTQTYTALANGPLSLATCQGEWASRTGELATPVEMYDGLTGGIGVCIIKWSGDPLAGLTALRDSGAADELIADEIGRLTEPVAKPDGWEYLWFLGPADIFTETPANGGRGIRLHAHNDVGILQKPVALEFTPDTTLSWRWRMEQLPSAVAEDLLPHHDYMSVAVEFDNGLDLTYYGSAALPEGTHYACPIPMWAARETHLVIRSGAEGIGEWFDERRNVYEDYATAIGGEAPGRVVAVWLIGVTLFQHTTGIADFADIRLQNGTEQQPVL